ncbi:NAD-dependent epimerase/dehydratase family protein [Cognatiluteimonas telluris]|jgi:UDP-glucose 4-epimerase|uniref:NAD-dependent epimerase/dehydratase family protein n=1 Tax=Cognatiluteimonas telluris TaxID=1104775 RepID=UPI00140A6F48|nr:NAD-dependent epimerase/dehydratase family protein [Lysobacter telluris]
MSDAVLVLGAGGFIGRHLAAKLANDGRDVIAATRSPVAFGHARIRNVVAPWDDPGQFARWLPACGVVVHAASSSTPGSSAAQPQLDGNLRTTLALVEALQDAPSRRLLFLSSGGTLYGDRSGPAREDDALRPRSYHAAGKIAAEYFIRAWADQYGGGAAILRPSNVYGPGQAPRRGFGIIATAFDHALSGAPLSVLGDGHSIRDFLYIDDLVAAVASALVAPLPPGAHACNLASGAAIELNDLLDRIDAVTRRPLQRVFQPARSIDIRTIALDNSRARTWLQWSPTVALEDGLERTWDWHQRQA